MKIKFNEVTWYSKLLAAIFIFAIFPIIVFCIGRKYESIVSQEEVITSYTEVSMKEPSTKCEDQIYQTAMNQCAADELVAAQALLDQTYASVMEKDQFSSDIGSSIKDAQAKWLSYMNSECSAEGMNYEGGSLEPYTVSTCKTGLIKDRIRVLEVWLSLFSV
jgi:uncharacterized protein YecT (DUF1311 family)